MGNDELWSDLLVEKLRIFMRMDLSLTDFQSFMFFSSRLKIIYLLILALLLLVQA